MAISRSKKEEIVKIVSENAKTAKSGVFIEYKGSTVAEMEGLRNELRQAGSNIKVAKKNLIKIALKEAGYDAENMPILDGQVAIAFGSESEVAAPKAVDKFIKGKETFKILGGLMNGEFLAADRVIALAKLPTRIELLGQLVGTIAAPMSSLVFALNDVNGRFVRVLDGIRKKSL